MADSYVPVHSFLEGNADFHPDAVAVVHGEKSTTYAEVEEQANRLAQLLIERGVSRGDRIGLLADNSLEYIVGFFGILKAGAAAVALSGANKVRTTRQLLADSGAVALVTRAAQVRKDLPDLVRDLADLRLAVLDRANPQWELPDNFQLVTAGEVAACADNRPQVTVRQEDLAAILYTSGSTGIPRGVTLSHRNLAANTTQILAYLHLQSDDSVLVVLPFHYSFGKSLLLNHFAVGGKLVIDNRFAYPQVVLETMALEQVTGFSGVPSTYAILCAKTDFLTRDLPHLRYLTQAGGGMAPSLVSRIQEAFAGRAKVFIMYGQTEASARLSYVPPDRLTAKRGSIGIPIPGVELRVLREDGAECAAEEVGEVVAQGDNIMSGYWNDPQETSLVLGPEGLRTGDLGRKDADGFIFLVDRIKNMIKAGANRVSTREVEDTIAEVPGVVQVCVIGVPDELLGEAIEAHVVAEPPDGLSENDILGYLHKQLALYKIPRKVHFHEDLPKHPSGKIIREQLKNPPQ